MKLFSGRKFVKATALFLVLSSLWIFGGCGNMTQTPGSGSGTNTSSGSEDNGSGNEGNENGTDNPVDDDLMSQINALDSEKQSILINSLNDIAIFNESGISFSLRSLEDGSLDFTVTMPETVSFSVSPVYHKDETGADTEFADLIETYKKINADQASAFIQKVETAIELYELPDGLSDNEIDVTKVKTAAKAKVRANQNATTFEATPGTVSKIYFKISDLDSSALPAVSTQTPDAEIIPGVKRILSNNRTALDFTGLTNSSIMINFENKNTNVSSYYRGGFKFNKNTTLSSLNDEVKFIYEAQKEDFVNENIETEKSILDIKNAKFTSVNFETSDTNLYGFIDRFYESYKTKINTVGIYDAQEALIENSVQKTMFNPDNSYNSNASQIDADLASFLLSKGVNVRNVVINDTKSWSRNSGLIGTLANSVVQTSMENVTMLSVKGLVRFDKAFPQDIFLVGDGLTKIVQKEYNDKTTGYTGGGVYDISQLGGKQSDIVAKHASGCYYLGSDATSLSPSAGQVFIFSDGSYKKNASSAKIYSNKNIERAGNEETVSESEAIQLEGSTGTISNYPLSRANNIKLTPMQKLLLDNQNTIG